MVILQNAGIEATCVCHAALIVGAVPAIVALITVATGRGSAGPAAWVGFALALVGVGIVAGGGGGDASLGGDALMLASVTLSATFVVIQAGLLRGQDPWDAVSITAVQMFAGALAAVPNAALEGLPSAPASAGPIVALLALSTLGTLVPFALFAYGQSRVAPQLAGAFLNLEPLVGTAAGALAFGDPFGPMQLAGGAVILIGIALQYGPSTRARRCGLPHLRTPGNTLTVGGCEWETTYQAAPLLPLSRHDAPRPPTRPHRGSPHVCGPRRAGAPLLPPIERNDAPPPLAALRFLLPPPGGR